MLPELLSLFPGLLFLTPFAPLIIRVALGLVLFFSAKHHFAQNDMRIRGLGTLEGAVAVLLIVGAWTQGAALVALVIIGGWLTIPQFRTMPKSTALLSLALSFTLLMTGAGLFAIDQPF